MRTRREWATVTCKMLRDEARCLAHLAKLLGITRNKLMRGLLVPAIKEKLLSLESGQ